MQTRELYGKVQSKARLPDLDSTIRASRATLGVLAERIGETGARFDSDAFLREVTEMEDLLDQHPEDDRRLFAGAEGKMPS